MEKNPVGVAAFENTIVALQDNVIKRNTYWGVNIRYDVKVEKFTGNTITLNDNIGTQQKNQLLDQPPIIFLMRNIVVIWHYI